jgi:protein-S-isoprenylcysteine O-methyltransferase Ste14
MGLLIRNILFTVVVPGSGAVWVPWWILTRDGKSPEVTTWPAVAVIATGAALYLWCLWLFATVGRGTPGPWDAPRRFVAVGPYRWVRNPIYIGALLVVSGEAWLFGSIPLLVYAGAMAVVCHLFVIGYEERALARPRAPVRDRLRRVPIARLALDPAASEARVRRAHGRR